MVTSKVRERGERVREEDRIYDAPPGRISQRVVCDA
jgi:hypothetical protein